MFLRIMGKIGIEEVELSKKIFAEKEVEMLSHNHTVKKVSVK